MTTQSSITQGLVAQVFATEVILKSSLVLEERMLLIAFSDRSAAASIEQATEKLTIIFEGTVSVQGQ